jgi:hypothetical protein
MPLRRQAGVLGLPLPLSSVGAGMAETLATARKPRVRRLMSCMMLVLERLRSVLRDSDCLEVLGMMGRVVARLQTCKEEKCLSLYPKAVIQELPTAGLCILRLGIAIRPLGEGLIRSKG